MTATLNAMPTGPMTQAQINAQVASDAQARLAQDTEAQQELTELSNSGQSAPNDPNCLDDPTGTQPFSDSTATGLEATVALSTSAVAGGHILWDDNGKIDAWHYHSKEMFNIRFVCKDGVCVAVDAIAVKFYESVLGGKSNKWIITTYRRRVEGSTPYKSPAWIACAVNISGAPDVYCPDWRDDGANESLNVAKFDNGEDFIRNFGSTAIKGTIKYPILTLATHWADQTESDKAKFRGWDMCASDRTDRRLCTGTGHGPE